MSTYDEVRQAAEDALVARKLAHGHGNGNGRIRVDPAVGLQILAWIVGVLVAYSVVRVDVAVLQTKQMDLERRLERMEQKLDILVDQVRR